MKLVKFMKKTGVYNGGEVAGFPDREADQMISAGHAVHHDPKDAGSRKEADTQKDFLRDETADLNTRKAGEETAAIAKDNLAINSTAPGPVTNPPPVAASDPNKSKK